VAVVIRSAAPAVWRAALPATAHPQESSSPARAFLVTRPGPFARAQGMTRPLVYQPVRVYCPRQVGGIGRPPPSTGCSTTSTISTHNTPAR
jgi:hypothetical protein